MSQPALSQSIVALEESLGVRLFERSRRVVTLNPIARPFLARCETILADVRVAIGELRAADDPAAGQVEIACLSSIATRILPDIVRRFRETFPGVIVRVFDDDPDGIVEKVRRRRVDLAYSCQFRPEEGITFTPLIEDTLQFVCRRGNPIARRKRITWEDLAAWDVVGLARGSSIRALIDRHVVPARLLKSATYEVAKVSSILDIVEGSDSVSVVPALALAYPRARQLFHFRPIGEPEIKREIGLMVANGVVLSSAARAFHRLASNPHCYSDELSGLPVRLLRASRPTPSET